MGHGAINVWHHSPPRRSMDGFRGRRHVSSPCRLYVARINTAFAVGVRPCALDESSQPSERPKLPLHKTKRQGCSLLWRGGSSLCNSAWPRRPKFTRNLSRSCRQLWWRNWQRGIGFQSSVKSAFGDKSGCPHGRGRRPPVRDSQI